MNLSMELALNLLWAVVSFVLLVGAEQRGFRRRELFRAVAALALAFVLFPIISITDDLNSAPAMVETQQSSEVAAQSPHSSGPAGVLLPFISSHNLSVATDQEHVISTLSEGTPQSPLTFTQSRRPPPVNSI